MWTETVGWQCQIMLKILYRFADLIAKSCKQDILKEHYYDILKARTTHYLNFCLISEYFKHKGLSAPLKSKTCSMYISDYIQTTFFHLGIFLKNFLADDQCSWNTKGSIYHIKHMSTQLFTMGVDWHEIGCLMDVSIMFHNCKYCFFTLFDS